MGLLGRLKARPQAACSGTWPPTDICGMDRRIIQCLAIAVKRASKIRMLAFNHVCLVMDICFWHNLGKI